MDNKDLKNILTGIGLFFLIIGQYFILAGNKITAGVIFTVLFALVFLLVFSGKYTLITELFSKIAEFIKNYKAVKLAKKEAPVKTGKLKAEISKGGGTEAKAALPAALPGFNMVAFFEKFGREGISFFIPKWFFFAIVGVFFVTAQIFLFTGRLIPALFILVAAVIMLLAGLAMKQNGVTAHISLGSGLKVVSMIAGFALIITGWILLLNHNTITQEWGVAFTIPGCLLAYFGLPKKEVDIPMDQVGRTDILFLKPEILNNYFVKAVLLILAFICLKTGYKVMFNQDYNMYSMIFYGLAIVLVYFALPLFNFAEKPIDNRVMHVAKMVFVIIAVFIAYLAQKDYVANKPNDAVVKYLVAAFIFIFSFPMYLSKEAEQKEPFPIQAEVIFMIVIMLVGFYLRVNEIDQIPFGLENDEAGGYTARMSRTGEITLPLSVGNFGLPLHIVRFFIPIIGELNRISIKMLGVSVGLLSIPMIYFFIRSIVSPRAAIFATTLFTFLRWNLHYSRSGHGYVFSNAVEIMALYFMFKAIETRNKFIWLVAGFCVGLTWHGIMTAFLLIVPIGLYFIISSFSRKGFLKANAVGIFAFIFGFWIFGSMIVHNFFLSKSIYFARVNEVSVFSKDPNAPSKNPAKGIVDNTRLVLEMFNRSGDSRQRNSGGQPYEPTIDFVSSMLYALGFFYCIYYSRYYLFFVMVMVFFSQAAGSIFSIEAPSAMRAVGAMIPMVFFIAVIFDKLWVAFRKALGKKAEWVYYPLLLAVFLVPIIKDNYKQYFGRWVGGMDELTTATGKYARALGDKWRVVLYTMTYYPGHPPFKISRSTKVDSAGRLTNGLTHMYKVDDDNFAFLFHYDTWENMNQIKQVYFPESKVEEVDHKYFNPKLKPGEGFGMFTKAILVTNEELKRLRGMTGTYSFGGQPLQNELPVFKQEDNAKVPYTATWKASFMARYYGKFRFFNEGTAKFSLNIDGVNIPEGKTVTLAEGFHKMTIVSARKSAADTLQISFQSQELIGKSIRGTETVKLDGKYLYKFRTIGLHGYYYNGNSWDDNNKEAELIDANLWFDGAIWTTSGRWSGTIDIKEPGEYKINASCNNYCRIVIDGNKYWEQAGNANAKERADAYFKDKPMQAVNAFKLGKGKHKIDVYTMNATIMHLMWSPPGKGTTAVPIDILEPDYQITSIQ